MNSSQMNLPEELLTIVKEYALGYKIKTNYREMWRGDRRFKHGHFRGWYHNENLEYESRYKHGKLYGICRMWFVDGELKSVKYYNGDGKIHEKEWYHHSRISRFTRGKYRILRCEKIYNEDGRTYEIERGWHINGNKNYERNYNKYGKLHGIDRSWYYDGNPHYERTYNNGIKCGCEKEWYSNGLLSCENNYNDKGELDGKHKVWNKNGKPEFEGYFKNGEYYGFQKEWYDNGQLHHEESLRGKNKWHGICRVWDRNGQLVAEANTNNSKMHGIEKRWDNENKRFNYKYYYNGIELDKEVPFQLDCENYYIKDNVLTCCK